MPSTPAIQTDDAKALALPRFDAVRSARAFEEIATQIRTVLAKAG